MKTTLTLLIPLLPCIACDGGGARTPPALVTTLTAEPASFTPGAAVSLRPRFVGVGRIDPDVGPVVSGGAYEVGPSSSGRSYSLTVVRDGRSETVRLDVPLTYRERVRELPTSAVARTRHGAAVLDDGRVLIVAGASPTPVAWRGAELFDGETDAFTAAGEITTGRSECVVVALPGGAAVAFGGTTNSSSFEEATRIERWDPTSRSWSVVGNMRSNRAGMTGTALVDGRVLITGGLATGGAPEERDAELYEPGVGSRSPAGEMRRRRAGHSATRLLDGRVWIAGGADPGTGELVAATELFDPATEQFDEGPRLLWRRLAHAAVRLDDGRVLLVGGDDGAGVVATAEVFDPTTGALRAAGEMASPRALVRAALLPNGHVLAVGGADASGPASDSIEEYSPASMTWRSWSGRLPARRTGHSLHVLSDGRVVVLGGDPGNGYPSPTCFVLD